MRKVDIYSVPGGDYIAYASGNGGNTLNLYVPGGGMAAWNMVVNGGGVNFYSQPGTASIKGNPSFGYGRVNGNRIDIYDTNGNTIAYGLIQ